MSIRTWYNSRTLCMRHSNRVESNLLYSPIRGCLMETLNMLQLNEIIIYAQQ